MKNKTKILAVSSALVAALSASGVQAKVPAAEAAKLGIEGTELTPMGAVRAGNAEGTIPEWTGGLPQKTNAKGAWLPNPFAEDKPLFVITAANYGQYTDKLSPGQQEMFALYPDYVMNIYPSRRSASNHKYVYDAVIENATTGELTASGNDFTGVKIGPGFPIPQNGNEAALSFATKVSRMGTQRWSNTTVVTSNGKHQTSKIIEEILSDWSKEGNTAESFDGENDVFYFMQTVRAPAKKAGSVILILGLVHNDVHKRRIWSYNPGQRRVRRAPQVQYDNPKTGGDGLATSDQLGMYNGNIDRYSWTLVGKQEMYIPYNSYLLHDGTLKIDDIIQAGHINQDYARYELHRVWHVEGVLREGTSHVYKKRVFFMDEDSWQIAVMDHYDKRMQLWRMSEGHIYNDYSVLVTTNTAEIHYDLQSGRYLAVGLDNEDTPDDTSFRSAPNNYTPAALRSSGIR
ncbi:MAG: DUF1329 domain-containing protein [Pseudomonadales bacterium]|nr:DUF1329 domain-containing protein [Pseudomonadales bacterium]